VNALAKDAVSSVMTAFAPVVGTNNGANAPKETIRCMAFRRDLS
jgi:hypothetical protein